MESGILGFGIPNKAQRIRNPINDWNLESSSTDKDLNQVPGIRNPRREVQNPRLPEISLQGARKKNWEKLGMALIVEKGLYRSDVNKGCLFRDVPLYKGVGALSDPNKVSIRFVIPVLNSL